VPGQRGAVPRRLPPFFLGAGAWAVTVLGVRLAELGGLDVALAAFDGLSRWHAHELLFGYGGAVVAGFALTAIPNWTGRLPVAGRALAALWTLWLLGRLGSLLPSLPGYSLLILDAPFLFALALLAGWEILAGRNYRNLGVLALIALLAGANVCFHLEALRLIAAEQTGQRMALAALILLIGLIGGRITPSFTNNWFARTGQPRAATSPPLIEHLAHGLTAAAFAAWIALPEAWVSGGALLAAALAQFARLAGWPGWRTLAEPLVLALHAGYAWIPVGLVLLGVAILWDASLVSGGVHALTTGAIGLMTLAVMTRATLGHTGRSLHASPGTTALYAAVATSALTRVGAALLPAMATGLLPLAGGLWIVAYALFLAIFGPVLLRPRLGNRSD